VQVKSSGTLFHPASMSARPGQSHRALSYRNLAPLPSGAEPLEMRGEVPVVAAWREGAGRVLQVGYQDTWRWRMESAGAEAEHRAWWAGLVATVAMRSPRIAGSEIDPAPLAALTTALGPPSSLPTHQPVTSLWPFVLLVLVPTIVGEWLLRRLRGVA
jgi:hypothetical protein